MLTFMIYHSVKKMKCKKTEKEKLPLQLPLIYRRPLHTTTTTTTSWQDFMNKTLSSHRAHRTLRNRKIRRRYYSSMLKNRMEFFFLYRVLLKRSGSSSHHFFSGNPADQGCCRSVVFPLFFPIVLNCNLPPLPLPLYILFSFSLPLSIV